MKKNGDYFKTLALVSAGACAGLGGLNRLVRKQAVSGNLLRTDNGSFYPWKYGRVFYRVSGRVGEPLLLLHAAGEQFSSFEWHAVVRRLGEKYRVYSVDLPGCGRSYKPAIEYTNYLYASFTLSFIRDVIKAPAIVAATGLSGSFAVTAAFLKPKLISRLVLINPESPEVLSAVPDKKSYALRRLVSLPLIGECLYHIETNRRNTQYLFGEKIFYNPFRLNDTIISASREAANKGGGSGRYLRASLDGKIFHWNIDRALSSLSQDVVLIFGAGWQHDRLDSIKASYLKLCPRADVRMVPLSGFLPQLENPAAFMKCIEGVL